MIDFQQLYLLIGSLERDLREVLEEFVFSSHELSDEIAGVPSAAIERAEADPAFQEGSTRISDYLETNDSWKLINRNSSFIPDPITSVVAEFTPRLDAFAPIRHRVMHHRPLEPGDLETAFTVCQDLAERKLGLVNLERAVRLIESGDSLPIEASENERPESPVLHNLPGAQFDETGLLGRREEVEHLKKLLLDDKYPVITIRGAGGIGKTALAVKVLHDLVWDQDSPVEVILWHSLKENALTPGGVVQLKESVLDTLEIVSRFQETITDQAVAAVHELADTLEDVPAIITLDNLETDDGMVFRELYEAMPSSVSFLTTTRVGIGELERVIELGPLEERAAVSLFRVLSRNRQLDILNGIDDVTAKEVVSQLRCNPLSIKWFVEAVEAGIDPDDALANQEELLDFSIGAVYRSLTEASQKIAMALLYAEKPLSKAELSLTVEVSALGVGKEVQELQRNSIIQRVRKDRSSLDVAFSLDPTVADFLRSAPERELTDSIQARAKAVGEAGERLERDRARNDLNPNVIHPVEGTPNEDAVRIILREAMSASMRGDYESALNRVDNARELSPAYYEVPRVAGFIRAVYDPARANSDYEEAYKLATEWHRGKVRYFQSWLFIHKTRDIEQAEIYAREAHEILGSPASAIRLGDALMQRGQFDAAQGLISEAINDTSDEKTRLIGHTLLLSLAKRRVEEIAREEKRPARALEVGREAFAYTCRYINERGIADRRLRESAFSLLAECLGAASLLGEPGWTNSRAIEAVRRLLEEAEETAHLFTDLDASVFLRAAGRLIADPAVNTDAKQSIEDLVEARQEKSQVAEETGEQAGVIDKLHGNRNFGFIFTDTGERRYFSFAQVDVQDRLLLVAGRRVKFSEGTNSQGVCANNVRVDMKSALKAGEMLGREVIVTEVKETYATGRETHTDSSIILFAAGFENAGDWEAVAVGDRVICDIDLAKGDRPVKGTAFIDRTRN